MKDSGVRWIGLIPEEWNISKVKYVSKIKYGLAHEKDWLSSKENEREYIIVNSKFVSTEGKVKKIVGKQIMPLYKGDICTVLSDLPNGKALAKCYYIDEDAKYSLNQRICAYYDYDMDKRYFFYFMNRNQTLLDYNDGLNQTNLKNEYVECCPVLIPPRIEQVKIANFLDEKVEEIDTIISKTKKTIKEYKLYKQAVITEAITKGLDSTVPMKDSGIEWIGQIPIDWKTVKIKNTSWLKGRIGWQGLKSNEYQDEGAYLITGTDFCNGVINWDSCVHISDERFEEAPEIHIKEADLLITKDGTIGKVAIAKDCPEKVSLNSGVLLIRNTKDFKYHDKYLYFVLLSDQFWVWYEMSQTGNSTIKHLYQEQFYNFEFTYPSMEEQQRIAEYLEKQVEDIDALIAKKEAFVEEMETYKKSLIYEYVTGKKEVL
ncbi:MAG: restriction endonuclease subunit S [Lachnospiraceae bacterium]|nr:restriction endonuclease subunit S [Lachnospiraceae bacterium]